MHPRIRTGSTYPDFLGCILVSKFYFELSARIHPRIDPKTKAHPFVQFAQK
jgi:hypothetical protein